MLLALRNGLSPRPRDLFRAVSLVSLAWFPFVSLGPFRFVSSSASRVRSPRAAAADGGEV